MLKGGVREREANEWRSEVVNVAVNVQYSFEFVSK